MAVLTVFLSPTTFRCFWNSTLIVTRMLIYLSDKFLLLYFSLLTKPVTQICTACFGVMTRYIFVNIGCQEPGKISQSFQKCIFIFIHFCVFPSTPFLRLWVGFTKIVRYLFFVTLIVICTIRIIVNFFSSRDIVKLLPLPQPPVRARTDARTNPSAQRATQLRSVLARVYAVSIQNQITTTVP
jgi:hypothetical protein